MPSISGNDITLESIIRGRRCTPLSAFEFEQFLLYRDISHENLQFVSWVRGYRRRFAALPADVRKRAPAPLESSSASAVTGATRKSVRPSLIRLVSSRRSNEPTTPLSPATPQTDWSGSLDSPLPFQDEVKALWATFLEPGAPKELNISSEQYQHVRAALGIDATGTPRVTTHPAAFDAAYKAIFQLMESDTLPKFIRHASGNINTAKQRFWYAVGATDFGVGLAVCLITLFLAHSRWYRFIGLPFICFGAMQLYSASLRFCTQVYGRDARQTYAWELADPSLKASEPTPDPETGAFVLSELKRDRPASTASTEADVEKGASLKVDFATPAPSAGLDSLRFQCPWEYDEPALAQPHSPYTPTPTRPTHVSRATELQSRALQRAELLVGVRVPTFGPERQILDPAIKQLHARYIQRILFVGAAAVVVFGALFLALPVQR